MKKVLLIAKQLPPKGFILVFATLLLGIILAIGLAISGFAISELFLSQAVTESAKAIVAASSGIELALYLDRKESLFGPGTVTEICPLSIGGCSLPRADLDFPTTKSCAIVKVEKPDGVNVKFTSRGLSPCSNPSRGAQRALCATIGTLLTCIE